MVSTPRRTGGLGTGVPISAWRRWSASSQLAARFPRRPVGDEGRDSLHVAQRARLGNLTASRAISIPHRRGVGLALEGSLYLVSTTSRSAPSIQYLVGVQSQLGPYGPMNCAGWRVNLVR